MNTILKKLFQDAWTSGIYLPAPPVTENKEIYTNIIKRALNRGFAHQPFSHLLIPALARSRYLDKWLRVHTTH
jgi:hypothetical protein